MSPSSRPSLLMVTREIGEDRRYGLGKSLAPVVRELSRRGWRVRYLCQDDLPKSCLGRRERWFARSKRWPLCRVDTRLRMLFFAWLERLDMGRHAAVLARTEAYSHVHVHDPWIGLGFWLAACRQGLSGVRWGLTEHGFGSYSQATRADGLAQGPWTQHLMCWLERRVLAVADWVIVPTQLARDQLARDLRISSIPSHWHVVPHAGPGWVLPPREEVRHELGWATNGIYILGVGRLVPLKRFDLLLEIFLSLASRNPEVYLCLLGEGPLGPDFWEQARRAGFESRVLIAGSDDVQRYFAASDIYVSLSMTESFGLANLEALSAGLPSLCTAVGGVPEVVAEGAYLIDASCEEAARVIEEWALSQECRSRWARRARHRMVRWPDIQAIGRTYVSIYQL